MSAPPSPARVLPAGALDDVETALAAALDRAPSVLRAPCRRIAFAGGKRLRPALVLAAALHSGHELGTRATNAAVAVELLHLATLVHDDLMDAAPTRRGVATISAAEGPSTALLAGDVLIALAGRLAARVDGHTATLLQDALVDLCAGQADEAQHRWNPAVTAADVQRVARYKTGTLPAAACQIGAALGGSPTDPRALALGAYGMSLGTCLQLLDDLLDLLSDEATYGKPTQADFPAGTVTLPAVHELAAQPALAALLRPGLTAAERDRATAMLRAGPGVTATLCGIEQQVMSARRHLPGAPGPDGAAVAAMLADLPRRYADRQLALVLPAHRHLLSAATRPPATTAPPATGRPPATRVTPPLRR